MLNVKEMLTIKQAAEVLDMSTRSIHRYIKSGKLKAFMVGNKWRFLPEDIDRFIKGE